MEIRATVRAARPTADVLFGFHIINRDGVRCYGTNTEIDGLPAAALDGEGTVVCVIDRLDLLEGTYSLDVAVGRPDGTPYDRDHRCTFTVTSTRRDIGIFRPPHQWSFGGGITMPSPATPAGGEPGR